MIDDDIDSFCEIAKQWGATEATPISPQDVVVGEWVRLKCQFGCDGYGKRLTCPPYSPTPETTKKILAEYSHAILLRFEGDNTDDSWKKTHDLVTKLERKIFLSNYYKVFGFENGPCFYCDKCNLKSCIHAEVARPSMEASVIDVYATARNTRYKLHVVKSKEDNPVYFSLILIQ